MRKISKARKRRKALEPSAVSPALADTLFEAIELVRALRLMAHGLEALAIEEGSAFLAVAESVWQKVQLVRIGLQRLE
jgi:hypothetical protein